MTWVDWTIVAAAGTFITWLSFTTTKHMQSVADFLTANRSAGRYMMTLSGGMASVGAIAVVAMFEIYHKVGDAHVPRHGSYADVWMADLSLPRNAMFDDGPIFLVFV